MPISELWETYEEGQARMARDDQAKTDSIIWENEQANRERDARRLSEREVEVER